MDERKNSINISQAIDGIYEYLRVNMNAICKPLIDYFDKANDMKSISVIDQDFNNTLNTLFISEICEWLCEEGVLVKDVSEVHLTTKSSSVIYEPAYFKCDKDVDILF